MTLADAQRIEQLEAEVAHWKEQAQRNASAETAERIRRAFGLTAGEAWVLAQLHAARGAVVRGERLTEDMPGKSWEDRADEGNTLAVLVHRIRRKVGADSVLTVRSHGYRLATRMLTKIDRVLQGYAG